MRSRRYLCWTRRCCCPHRPDPWAHCPSGRASDCCCRGARHFRKEGYPCPCRLSSRLHAVRAAERKQRGALSGPCWPVLFTRWFWARRQGSRGWSRPESLIFDTIFFALQTIFSQKGRTTEGFFKGRPLFPQYLLHIIDSWKMTRQKVKRREKIWPSDSVAGSVGRKGWAYKNTR